MHCFAVISIIFTMTSTTTSRSLDGGFTQQNASEYTEEAWKAVPQINENDHGQFYLVPIRVLKAQVQVVAGTNTELEVLVGESSCETAKQPVSRIAAANCGPRAHGARALYRVSIWEKSWEHFEQITAEKIRDVADGENF